METFTSEELKQRWHDTIDLHYKGNEYEIAFAHLCIENVFTESSDKTPTVEIKQS